jgi:hypothetical protein
MCVHQVGDAVMNNAGSSLNIHLKQRLHAAIHFSLVTVEEKNP